MPPRLIIQRGLRGGRAWDDDTARGAAGQRSSFLLPLILPEAQIHSVMMGTLPFLEHAGIGENYADLSCTDDGMSLPSGWLLCVVFTLVAWTQSSEKDFVCFKGPCHCVCRTVCHISLALFQSALPAGWSCYMSIIHSATLRAWGRVCVCVCVFCIQKWAEYTKTMLLYLFSANK